VSVSVQAFPSLHVVPLLFDEQVPSDPARLHAWHWLVHELLQHTPLTQNPDAHWLFDEQASPKLAS
jgi:hypothetical protein